MGTAAKKLGLLEVDMQTWSDEWLESAGPSEFTGHIQADADGNITEFKVTQKLYGKCELNRLRT